MQLTCPCCHARLPLEAAVQDAAGRELLALLAGVDAALARPLVSYLGLFRATKTQLGWDRALRLARETLALEADAAVLAEALTTTFARLEEKRAQAGWKPLANHNYLRQLVGATAARAEAAVAVSVAPAAAPRAPRSLGAKALLDLEGLKRGS